MPCQIFTDGCQILIAETKGNPYDGANAAYIVHAVNAYEELLKSLKKLERLFSDEKIKSSITKLDQYALDEIRGTITKAEGRI
jgi:hypothetical protein